MAPFNIPGHASAEKANRQLKERLINLDPTDSQYKKCKVHLRRVNKQLDRFNWLEEKQVTWTRNLQEREYHRNHRLEDAKRVQAKILRGTGEAVLEGTMLVIETVLYTPYIICVIAPYSAGVM